MRKLQGRISKSPIPDQKKVSPSRGAGGKFTSRPAEQSAPLANQEHWGPCRDWRHAPSSLALAGLRRSSTRCIGVRDQRRYAPRAEHLKFPERRHGPARLLLPSNSGSENTFPIGLLRTQGQRPHFGSDEGRSCGAWVLAAGFETTVAGFVGLCSVLHRLAPQRFAIDAPSRSVSGEYQCIPLPSAEPRRKRN
jgi:hypothetical protein